MHKLKVIIIDDSAVIRSVFTEMLSSDEFIEVVAVAEDPYDAREKIKRFNPDVITLDVEMPKMDGISFLEKIMALRPMPVVMISSLTTRGADITMRALEMGAADYIAKPEMLDEQGYNSLKKELISKIKHAALIKPGAALASGAGHPVTYQDAGQAGQFLIAIGASTGGVEAIRDIILTLPANTPPVVITQHMPEVFTATFAKRMDQLAAMKVHEASDGDKILPGHIYIAPGNYHMEVQEKGSDLFCKLNSNPIVSGHRPSVDVLMESVANVKRRTRVGVILTGMGRDGADGLLKLRQSGAHTLGQSEGTCVVYGMPKAAMQIGAVEKEVPLGDMSRQILQLCTTQGATYVARRH